MIYFWYSTASSQDDLNTLERCGFYTHHQTVQFLTILWRAEGTSPCINIFYTDFLSQFYSKVTIHSIFLKWCTCRVLSIVPQVQTSRLHVVSMFASHPFHFYNYHSTLHHDMFLSVSFMLLLHAKFLHKDEQQYSKSSQAQWPLSIPREGMLLPDCCWCTGNPTK